jgi:hypothetical protein
VALVLRQSAVWKTLILRLLSSASLCCLLPLFFVPPVNGVPTSLQWLHVDVAGGREEKDWWWSAEDAASASLYLLLLHPAF